MDIFKRKEKQIDPEQRQSEQMSRPQKHHVTYQMRLFVAGNEPNSALARQNISAICADHLEGDFDLQVIDVFKDFAVAMRENILITPALIIDKPVSVRVFGTLKDKDKVLAILKTG